MAENIPKMLKKNKREFYHWNNINRFMCQNLADSLIQVKNLEFMTICSGGV